MIQIATNPYRFCDFWSFFQVLGHRLLDFISGKLPLHELASDEIQLFTLWGLCISSALVGCFLVFKKMTMMANALCHTILLGIVVAFLILSSFFSLPGLSLGYLSFNVLFVASLLSALFTVFFTQFLIQKAKVEEDASIGLVFTFLFALGVILVTLFTKNIHLGTEAIMGNIDALDLSDLKTVFFVSLSNIVLFLLFFRGFKITTFDSLFADSVGISSSFFNYFLMVVTSATCIAAFRAVGVLLVLAFFVAPPLMARLICHSLKKVIALSFLLGATGSIVAVALSRHILVVTTHQFQLQVL